MIAALFTYAPDAAAQAKEGTWKSTLLGRGHTQGRWVGNWLLFVYDENGTTDGDGYSITRRGIAGGEAIF